MKDSQRSDFHRNKINYKLMLLNVAILLGVITLAILNLRQLIIIQNLIG